MAVDPQTLHRFLDQQSRDFGGRTEGTAGNWVLFSVPIADPETNALVQLLLAAAPFPHASAPSGDHWWTIYEVATAHRPEAIDWLTATAKIAAGEIRPVTTAQAALIAETLASPTPHRAARELAEQHTRGTVTAGLIRRPADVRALLDRLHVREPLYFSAFHLLLTHHLVDMVVLHRQLIAEDVALKNEIVRAGLSHDPFLQSRQDATAEIRNILLRFRIINPLDQQKNTATTNPYAVYLEITRDGDRITAPIDGITLTVQRADFIAAIHAIRRVLDHGAPFGTLTTQDSWMNETMAYAFRFIRQRVESHRELTVMDALYMLERSVE